MEGQLIEKTQAQIQRWHDRQLSLYGRVLLANSVLMTKLWYTARITPFSDSFNAQVKTCLRKFVWNGRQSKVEWDFVTLPKTQGGLGLLPFEKQTQAIFAQFTVNMFCQKHPPWWAATAQWVFDQCLGQKNMHFSDLLAIAPPKRIPKGLPTYWDRVLRTWYALKGNGPDETFNGSIETILGLPFDHPAVYLLIEISAAARKRLRANKLFTLGDIFERYEPTGAAISREDLLLQPYMLAFGQHRVNLHPHVVCNLLNYLLEPDRRAVWAYAQLGGVPLDAYSPRQGQLTAASTEVAPIRLDRWERKQVHNHIARTETDIKRLSKAHWIRLPKLQTALAIIANGSRRGSDCRNLFYIIPDLEPVYKYCSAITRSSDANDESEETEGENIAHLF